MSITGSTGLKVDILNLLNNIPPFQGSQHMIVWKIYCKEIILVCTSIEYASSNK